MKTIKYSIALFIAIQSISSAYANKTQELSCSVPPLKFQIFSDDSVRATYDDWEDDDDNEKIITDVRVNTAGTGMCAYKWWIFDYMKTTFEVREFGCTPSSYKIPQESVAELHLNGKLLAGTADQLYMDDGIMFWCY